jgi:hypothetical protein
MPIDKLNAPVRWHGAALGFFGFGFVAGALCAAAGPVVGIRLLGAIALASSALGLSLVAYTWSYEEPAAWASAIQSARAWRSRTVASWRRLWARRSTFDRYWQNVVWAGME